MAIKSYSVPTPPGYPAPTPHAANVAHEPFKAPEGDLTIPDLSPKLGPARETESSSAGD